MMKMMKSSKIRSKSQTLLQRHELGRREKKKWILDPGAGHLDCVDSECTREPWGMVFRPTDPWIDRNRDRKAPGLFQNCSEVCGLIKTLEGSHGLTEEDKPSMSLLWRLGEWPQGGGAL